MQGACQELPIAYESWWVSTEHLPREARAMGHLSPKGSSTQGHTDPVESPRKGPIWRCLDKSFSVPQKPQWVARAERTPSRQETRCWPGHGQYDVCFQELDRGNWMRKRMWACSASCKVLLLLVDVVKQKSDIRHRIHNVQCDSFLFPLSSIFQERSIREHSKRLNCWIDNTFPFTSPLLFLSQLDKHTPRAKILNNCKTLHSWRFQFPHLKNEGLKKLGSKDTSKSLWDPEVLSR